MTSSEEELDDFEAESPRGLETPLETPLEAPSTPIMQDDVLAAAADIMELMTPPKKRMRERQPSIIRDLVRDVEEQPNMLTQGFDSPTRSLTLSSSILSPQKMILQTRLAGVPDQTLPFNTSHIFDLCKELGLGQDFSLVAHNVEEFL